MHLETPNYCKDKLQMNWDILRENALAFSPCRLKPNTHNVSTSPILCSHAIKMKKPSQVDKIIFFNFLLNYVRKACSWREAPYKSRIPICAKILFKSKKKDIFFILSWPISLRRVRF